MADNQELQQPEKAKGGGISMPVFVGGLLGMALIVAVFMFLMFKFVINPEPEVVEDADQTEEFDELKELELTDIDQEELEFLRDEKERKMMTLEKITTNPKGSTKYVQMTLALYYRLHPDLSEEGEFKEDSPEMMRVKTKTQSTVITFIRSKDEVELLNSTPEALAIQLKEKLKDFYRENNLFLREILISEYIIS